MATAAELPVRTRLTAPAVWALTGLLAAGLLSVRDPHVPGAWGFCLFRRLTGLPCPGCGGLRAVNDLAQGDLAAALASNAWVVLSLAGLVALVAGLGGQPAARREAPRWSTTRCGSRCSGASGSPPSARCACSHRSPACSRPREAGRSASPAPPGGGVPGGRSGAPPPRG